jgi:hypothetical protein
MRIDSDAGGPHTRYQELCPVHRGCIAMSGHLPYFSPAMTGFRAIDFYPPMNHRAYIDLVVGSVSSPVLTALWAVFVRVNNHYTSRKIDPRPWLTLFKLYMVTIFLTVMDLYRG